MLTRLEDQVGPLLATDRYVLSSRLSTQLTYTRSRIPRWAFVVAVVLPGPGFLALLVREHLHLHLDLVPIAADATEVTVHRSVT